MVLIQRLLFNKLRTIKEEAKLYFHLDHSMSPMNHIVSLSDNNHFSLELREWPMISKRAEEAKRAALMFQKKKGPELNDGEDTFFDSKEYHTSNKQVANILSNA